MEQELIHQTEWPLYLSLEQREQLFAGKIARAVVAVKQATPKNIANHGTNQNNTVVNRRHKHHIIN